MADKVIAFTDAEFDAKAKDVDVMNQEIEISEATTKIRKVSLARLDRDLHNAQDEITHWTGLASTITAEIAEIKSALNIIDIVKE